MLPDLDRSAKLEWKLVAVLISSKPPYFAETCFFLASAILATGCVILPSGVFFASPRMASHSQVITFGCRLNALESEKIRKFLEQNHQSSFYELQLKYSISHQKIFIQ